MSAESMPAMVSDDPHDWRPLVARSSTRKPVITDPIIEPLWLGTRVLAHFRSTPGGPGSGEVVLRDGDGEDVTSEFREIADALAGAVYADMAVIDGILTDQATAGGIGLGIVPSADISSVGVMLGQAPRVTIEPVRNRERPDDESEVAFVALDLLAVDGEPLLDLPLLERKRLLEGMLAAGGIVRISPYARPPVGQWLASWRSAGFPGVVMKAANSRYRADDVLRSWAVIERVSQR